MSPEQELRKIIAVSFSLGLMVGICLGILIKLIIG